MNLMPKWGTGRGCFAHSIVLSMSMFFFWCVCVFWSYDGWTNTSSTIPFSVRPSGHGGWAKSLIAILDWLWPCTVKRSDWSRSAHNVSICWTGPSWRAYLWIKNSPMHPKWKFSHTCFVARGLIHVSRLHCERAKKQKTSRLDGLGIPSRVRNFVEIDIVVHAWGVSLLGELSHLFMAVARSLSNVSTSRLLRRRQKKNRCGTLPRVCAQEQKPRR